MDQGVLTKGQHEPPEDRLAESIRLAEDSRRERNWKRWGPYLPERQWGTVREDYSTNGNSWDYFLTITRAAAFTGGAKTAFSDGATASAASVLFPLFGMARIPSSRSACSD